MMPIAKNYALNSFSIFMLSTLLRDSLNRFMGLHIPPSSGLLRQDPAHSLTLTLLTCSTRGSYHHQNHSHSHTQPPPPH
jgi:hypothetical protein